MHVNLDLKNITALKPSDKLVEQPKILSTFLMFCMEFSYSYQEVHDLQGPPPSYQYRVFQTFHYGKPLKIIVQNT